MSEVTERQYTALYFYYVEGWSHRKIGTELNIHHSSVQSLIIRGRRWITEAAAKQTPATLPFMRALFTPSPTSSLTAHLGRAASRQEELQGTLTLRMEQRAEELAEIEECMSGSHLSPTHIKRNHYDQWELRYLQAHGGEPLPTSAYQAGTAAAYCASDQTICGLDCHGCRRDAK